MSLTGKAKLAGVIGWPVTHSLSPVLHGHWLAELGIDGAMVPLAAGREDFTAVINGVRRAGFRGVNVTVPHKESAFAIAHMTRATAKGTHRMSDALCRRGFRERRVVQFSQGFPECLPFRVVEVKVRHRCTGLFREATARRIQCRERGHLGRRRL